MVQVCTSLRQAYIQQQGIPFHMDLLPKQGILKKNNSKASDGLKKLVKITLLIEHKRNNKSRLIKIVKY